MHTLLKLNREIDIQGIYTFYYFEHSRNYYYVGERHNFWELVYVDRGEISAVADNNGYILSQDNIIFHKPMEFHGMASVNNKPHNVLIITFECQSPAMDFFANKIFTVNKKQKEILSKVLKEFNKLFGNSHKGTAENMPKFTDEQLRRYQIGIGHIENFLLELMSEDNSVKRKEIENSLAKKNIENSLVLSIKEYLAQSIYTNLTLEGICKHFNISKSYICQLFKSETDTSIIDYYIELKIKEAKVLIREGNMNFSQIAEKLGYSSLQHFTRMFKKKTNFSPSMYEKSIE